jgi:hypothetical protein
VSVGRQQRTSCELCGERCRVSPVQLALLERVGKGLCYRWRDVRLCPICKLRLDQVLEGGSSVTHQTLAKGGDTWTHSTDVSGWTPEWSGAAPPPAMPRPSTQADRDARASRLVQRLLAPEPSELERPCGNRSNICGADCGWPTRAHSSCCGREHCTNVR